MRQFLPKSREGADYILNQMRADSWTTEGLPLLNDIAEKMEMEEALTESRLPSPFSRALQFYLALKRAPRDQPRHRARQTFRGLSALFALRDAFKLDLRLLITPPLEGPGAVACEFGGLLKSHLVGAPDGFADRGQFVYLALGAGERPPVLGGLSPLTCFYPAARALSESARRSIFWYDAKEARWLDPTVPAVAQSAFQRADTARLELVRRLIRSWLEGVLDPRHEGALIAAQMQPPDRVMVCREWQMWLNELSAGGEFDDHGVIEKPLAECRIKAESVPYLFLFVPKDVQKPPQSDLPERNGVFFVSKELLSDHEVRLGGDVFGSSELAEDWDKAPAEGPNLGAALGREEWYCRVPYVMVDKLFTPKLSRIGDVGIEADPPEEWSVLRDKLLGPPFQRGKDLWLYPFHPALLRYFPAAELRDGVDLIRSEVSLTVSLRLPVKEGRPRRQVSRIYYYAKKGAGHDLQLDADEEIQGLDLRVFPNFDLTAVPRPDLQLPFPEDRRYYARLRLSPSSEKLTWAPLLAADLPADPLMPPESFEEYSAGDFHPRSEGGVQRLAPGMDRFWIFKELERPPGGFSIDDHGLILLRLPKAQRATPSPWDIGIDFGTTNSCVTFKRGEHGATLALPIFTTSLLPVFLVKPLEKSHEGASALLDFFYWQAGEHALTAAEYFPTQVLTRAYRANAPRPGRPDRFDLRDGLAFFRNVPQTAVDEQLLTPVIHDFPTVQDGTLLSSIAPQFHLKDRIKLGALKEDDQASGFWRGVFQRHLRLQILFTAISQGAFVSKLFISYPRAFTLEEVEDYKRAVSRIWDYNHEVFSIAPPISESAAAARYLKVSPGTDRTVLDIGGGTTDVTVFSNNSLEAETSLRFAADVLDEYILASLPLRKCFSEAFSGTKIAGEFGTNQARQTSLRALQASFTNPSQTAPAAVRSTWYGFEFAARGCVGGGCWTAGGGKCLASVVGLLQGCAGILRHCHLDVLRTRLFCGPG